MKKLRNRPGSALVMVIVLAMVLLTVGTTMVLVNSSDTKTINPSGTEQSPNNVSFVEDPEADPPLEEMPLEPERIVTLKTRTPNAVIYYIKSDSANPRSLAEIVPGGSGVESGLGTGTNIPVSAGEFTIKACAYVGKAKSGVVTITGQRKPHKPAISELGFRYKVKVTPGETSGAVVYEVVTGTDELHGEPLSETSNTIVDHEFADLLSAGVTTDIRAAMVVEGVFSDPVYLYDLNGPEVVPPGVPTATISNVAFNDTWFYEPIWYLIKPDPGVLYTKANGKNPVTFSPPATAADSVVGFTYATLGSTPETPTLGSHNTYWGTQLELKKSSTVKIRAFRNGAGSADVTYYYGISLVNPTVWDIGTDPDTFSETMDDWGWILRPLQYVANGIMKVINWIIDWLS